MAPSTLRNESKQGLWSSDDKDFRSVAIRSLDISICNPNITNINYWIFLHQQSNREEGRCGELQSGAIRILFSVARLRTRSITNVIEEPSSLHHLSASCRASNERTAVSEVPIHGTMVVFLDLDEDVVPDDRFANASGLHAAGHHLAAAARLPYSKSAIDKNNNDKAGDNHVERLDPNLNSTTRALGCYPCESLFFLLRLLPPTPKSTI